jgi:hypothetical protein
MKRIAAASLAAFSSYGWTQQLVAVAPPADSSGFAVIAAVLVAGAGLVYLKVKRPEVLARLSSKVRSLVRRRPSALSAPLPLAIPVTPEVQHTISNVEFVEPAKQPPIYGWMIAENERLTKRIAQLERQLDAALRPPAPAEVTATIPAQFTGFLKA